MSRQLFDKPKAEHAILRRVMENMESYKVPEEILIAVDLIHDKGGEKELYLYCSPRSKANSSRGCAPLRGAQHEILLASWAAR
jgi:hypothetical protein